MFLDDFEDLKNQHIAEQATYTGLKELINETTIKLANLEENMKYYDNVMQVMLGISEYSRSSVQQHFEKFVTYILQYVLGEHYSFKINWTTGAKTTSVNFLVRSPSRYAVEPYTEDDFIETDPVSGKGGGVCDVVAFGLRLAFLTLLKNNAPIFLDESFSQLAKCYIPDASNLLHDVNDKFGYQIMFITHARDSAFTEDADQLITI